MELSHWFGYQLKSTLDGFIWAFQRLQTDRLLSIPPHPLGEWSAAQHLSHMVEYESELALPTMSLWLGAITADSGSGDKGDWQNQLSVEDMLVRFRQTRNAEIEMLPKFAEQDWNAVRRTPFWGEVSLFWLVCKTYQHTLEHTHDILRLSLFWDRVLERSARNQSDKQADQEVE